MPTFLKSFNDTDTVDDHEDPCIIEIKKTKSKKPKTPLILRHYIQIIVDNRKIKELTSKNNIFLQFFIKS